MANAKSNAKTEGDQNEMARKMNTSRAVVDRLLDPNNISLTLQNLENAAHALNKQVKINLVEL